MSSSTRRLIDAFEFLELFFRYAGLHRKQIALALYRLRERLRKRPRRGELYSFVSQPHLVSAV